MLQPRATQQPEPPAAHAALLDWQNVLPVARIAVDWLGDAWALQVTALGAEPDAGLKSAANECVRENPDAIGLCARR